MIENINHNIDKKTRIYIILLPMFLSEPKMALTKLKLNKPISPQFSPPIAKRIKAI